MLRRNILFFGWAGLQPAKSSQAPCFSRCGLNMCNICDRQLHQRRTRQSGKNKLPNPVTCSVAVLRFRSCKTSYIIETLYCCSHCVTDRVRSTLKTFLVRKGSTPLRMLHFPSQMLHYQAVRNPKGQRGDVGCGGVAQTHSVCLCECVGVSYYLTCCFCGSLVGNALKKSCFCFCFSFLQKKSCRSKEDVPISVLRRGEKMMKRYRDSPFFSDGTFSLQESRSKVIRRSRPSSWPPARPDCLDYIPGTVRASGRLVWLLPYNQRWRWCIWRRFCCSFTSPPASPDSACALPCSPKLRAPNVGAFWFRGHLYRNPLP